MLSGHPSGNSSFLQCFGSHLPLLHHVVALQSEEYWRVPVRSPLCAGSQVSVSWPCTRERREERKRSVGERRNIDGGSVGTMREMCF